MDLVLLPIPKDLDLWSLETLQQNHDIADAFRQADFPIKDLTTFLNCMSDVGFTAAVEKRLSEYRGLYQVVVAASAQLRRRMHSMVCRGFGDLDCMEWVQENLGQLRAWFASHTVKPILRFGSIYSSACESRCFQKRCSLCEEMKVLIQTCMAEHQRGHAPSDQPDKECPGISLTNIVEYVQSEPLQRVVDSHNAPYAYYDPNANIVRSWTCAGHIGRKQNRCHACKTAYSVLSLRASRAFMKHSAPEDVEDTVYPVSVEQLKTMLEEQGIAETMKILVESALRRHNNAKDSFCFQLALWQLYVLGGGSMSWRGIRYENTAAFFKDPEVLYHYTETLQFHGGKRVVDLLRGNLIGTFSDQSNSSSGVNGAHGKFPIDPSKTGLFIPSVSTVCKRLMPLDPFPLIESSSIKKKIDAFVNAVRRNRGLTDAPPSPIYVILSADGMDLRQGLVYLKSRALLLGHKEGPITEKSFTGWFDSQKRSSAAVDNGLIDEVIQFFISDIQGTSSIPLFSSAERSCSYHKQKELFGQLIDILSKHGVIVRWTTTDGFTGSEFMADMLNKEYGVDHIWDYVHLIKCLRNLLDRDGHLFKTDKRVDGFHMHTFRQEWQRNRMLQEAIKVHEHTPSDRMDLRPVLALISPTVTGILEKSEFIAVRELAVYLSHMRNYYDAWNDNAMSLSRRISLSSESVKYFRALFDRYPEASVSRETLCHLERSHDCLIRLAAWYEQQFGCEIPKLSHLGTNICENFFSVIRSKILFPNVFEFALLAEKVWRELVKKFSPDCPFPYSANRSVSKSYSNQHRLSFCMSDISFTSPAERVEALRNIKQNNSIADTSLRVVVQAQMTDLATALPPRRRVHNLRASVAKISYDTPRYFLYCPVEACPRHTYPWQVPGSLKNHIRKDHTGTNEKALLQVWKKVLRQLPDGSPVPPAVVSVEGDFSLSNSPQSAQLRSETESTTDEELVSDPDYHDSSSIDARLQSIGASEFVAPDISSELCSRAAIFVIDTETRSLYQTARIVQISALNGLTGEKKTFYINPGAETVTDSKSESIINWRSMSQRPDFESPSAAFGCLFDWIESHDAESIFLLAHNVPFDYSRILNNCRGIYRISRESQPKNYPLGDVPPGCISIPPMIDFPWNSSKEIIWGDIRRFAGWVLQTPFRDGGLSVDALAKRFGVDLSSHHQADADVKIEWDVLRHLAWLKAPARAPASQRTRNRQLSPQLNELDQVELANIMIQYFQDQENQYMCFDASEPDPPPEQA